MSLPKHVAIIMDGNGRWAQERRLPRTAGHEQGGLAAQKIVELCARKGIEVLTLFAFGNENWGRPATEIDFLMRLFLTTLQQETQRLQENNVQFRIIGDLSGFEPQLQQEIINAQQQTQHNTGLKLIIAANYSGRWDIIQGVRKLAERVKKGILSPHEIDVDLLNRTLCLADLPEPDLFIRTSGEQRISNFFLWQLVYTELYFTEVYWPEFSEAHFEKALQFYSSRERRFGLTSAQLGPVDKRNTYA